MIEELFLRLRNQAEQSKPDIRAAALLRLARVQQSFAPEQARALFASALKETRELPEENSSALFEQAELLAAAGAPQLLSEIPHRNDSIEAQLFRLRFQQAAAQRIGEIMFEHKHFNAAFEYVIHYDDAVSFPFLIASKLIDSLQDEERKREIFSRTLAAWREGREEGFLGVFRSYWRSLPAKEARSLVREIVRVIEEKPDEDMDLTYDQERGIHFTSSREHTFFHLFQLIRQIHPAMADGLIADYQQLAAAIQRYPKGMDSVDEETEELYRKAIEAGEDDGLSFEMDKNSEMYKYLLALHRASISGNFEPTFEHALTLYRRDTDPENPNQALQELWPSCFRFREILYRAGSRLGQEATVYLDLIPDENLRLFAHIELAAALAGLPEFDGIQERIQKRLSMYEE